MRSIGHPLFNDARYGGDRILRGVPSSTYQAFVNNCFDVCPRQALHARTRVCASAHRRTDVLRGSAAAGHGCPGGTLAGTGSLAQAMNNGTTPTGCTLGLIGRPLGHSYSKVFFDTLFERENRSESYGLFELPELTPATLYTLLLMNPCLRGFNVTAPYKEAIVPMLDSMDSVAQAVGAVNTVSVRRAGDGRVLALDGYNTDVAGFTGAIAPVLGEARPGALILGTGGASKAAAVAFDRLGIDFLKVSRTPSGNNIGYSDIDAALLERYPLVVNATPAGTWPDVDTAPPFPVHLLGPANICFDMVYNPRRCFGCGRARNEERGYAPDWTCCICRLLPLLKYGMAIF